jgi:hypothetical protein
METGVTVQTETDRNGDYSFPYCPDWPLPGDRIRCGFPDFGRIGR